jgi:hypothetical protein
MRSVSTERANTKTPYKDLINVKRVGFFAANVTNIMIFSPIWLTLSILAIKLSVKKVPLLILTIQSTIYMAVKKMV